MIQRSTNPKILAMYERRAAARGMTLEQWYETIEREHQESLEVAAITHDRSRQRAILARHAHRYGRTYRVIP